MSRNPLDVRNDVNELDMKEFEAASLYRGDGSDEEAAILKSIQAQQSAATAPASTVSNASSVASSSQSATKQDLPPR